MDGRVHHTQEGLIFVRMSVEEFLSLTGQTPDNPKKKKSKYKNVKMYLCDNGAAFDNKEVAMSFGKIIAVFDSKKEYERYLELLLLQKGKEISELKRQVKWMISDSCVYDGKIIKEVAYKADFQYMRDGKLVVEDVKPFDKKTQKYRLTKDFNIKWKLLKGKYPTVSFEIY